MTTYAMPVPQTDETYAFMLRLYFGPGENSLELTIKRAYGDFSRTQHGLSGNKNKEEIRDSCIELLLSEIPKLKELPKNKDEKIKYLAFDTWHRRLCDSLVEIYRSKGFNHFRLGQAQKWVNMALKYIFLFPGLAGIYAQIYPFCHIPIDNIILKALEEEKIESLLGSSDSWSRITSYKAYLEYQNKVRVHFSDSSPLAAEFHLWQS